MRGVAVLAVALVIAIPAGALIWELIKALFFFARGLWGEPMAYLACAGTLAGAGALAVDTFLKSQSGPGSK